MTFKKPYPPEVRERAVGMVFETQDDYGTQWAAIRSIAVKIGCSGEALRRSVRLRQADIDDGKSDGVTSTEQDELVQLRRRARILEQENEILRRASAYAGDRVKRSRHRAA